MDALKFATIKDVEIFATGTWNGATFNDKDIENVVDSFNQVGDKVKPFLKFGHDKNQKLVQSDGMPALGWIQNLKKVGSKLVADFVNVPDKVAELISAGAYRRVSSELYRNFIAQPEEVGEKKSFPWVLKAVALLGADTPAVTTLNDIIALGYTLESDAQEVVTVDFENKKEVKSMNEEKMEQEQIDFKKQIEEKDQALKDSQAKLDAQTAEFTELKAQLEKQEVEKKSLEVDAFISKMSTENRLFPAQIDQAKSLLFAMATDKDVVMFSSKEGDKEVSVFESFKSFIESMPAKEIEKQFSSSEKVETVKASEDNIDKFIEEEEKVVRAENLFTNDLSIFQEAQKRVYKKYPDLFINSEESEV